MGRKERHMKIYISGKITGTEDYPERFQRAAEAITAKGHEAINPLMLNTILNPWTTTWEQYMLADLGLLRASDAAYFMPGWEESNGARVEYGEAVRMQKRIFYQIEDIEEADT